MDENLRASIKLLSMDPIVPLAFHPHWMPGQCRATVRSFPTGVTFMKLIVGALAELSAASDLSSGS